MPAVKKELLWFGAGFALAAILSVSYEAVRRFVPIALAFGLLCFGCGVVLFVFLSLLRSDKEMNSWYTKRFDALREEESKLEMEKEAFKKDKEEFEGEKALWEWEVKHNGEPKAEESK